MTMIKRSLGCILEATLLILISFPLAFAALDVRTVWEVNPSATAANVNGGGFAPFNATAIANDINDLECTSGTTSAASCGSATYTFVAGDVDHWLFVSSGTGFTSNQFCKIGSISSGRAVLSSAAGACNIYGESRWTTNSSAGVGASTPSVGIFAIDRSRSTAAVQTTTTATVTTSVITGGSLTYNKTWNHNVIQMVEAGTGDPVTVGWYTIITSVAATSFTVDRNATATAAANVDINLGGAIKLGSSTTSRTDDNFFDLMTATNGTGAAWVWVNTSGTTAVPLGVSLSNPSGGTQAPIHVSGYKTVRGETTAESDWPIFSYGAALTFTGGPNWIWNQFTFTGGATTMAVAGGGSTYTRCNFINTATLTTRLALSVTNADVLIDTCGFQSYMGTALSIGTTQTTIRNSVIHDSQICFGATNPSALQIIEYTIFHGCVTNALIWTSGATARLTLDHLTIYGAENKLGIGLSGATGITDLAMTNSILYGLATGAVVVDTQSVGYDDFNDYYNNTADVSNWNKGPNDIAVDPAFTAVTQSTGTTATYTGTTLTDGTAAFTSALIGTYILVKSGTGLTTTNSIAKIATVPSGTTLTTDNDIGESSASNWTWQITKGLNFLPTGTLPGNPGIFPGAYTTGYATIGAVQKNSSGGGSSAGIIGQ